MLESVLIIMITVLCTTIIWNVVVAMDEYFDLVIFDYIEVVLSVVICVIAIIISIRR